MPITLNVSPGPTAITDMTDMPNMPDMTNDTKTTPAAHAEKSSAQAVAELRGIGKTYYKPDGSVLVDALVNVYLEIWKGQYVAIMGASGSGKSTLLRLLAGVERPSGGRLEVLGGNPDDARVRRALGFLPESSPFLAELS
ncbi:MAG: ATP-binding cassette domain-containing protein, partial [Phycisphaerales bacterium]|nr:ATP-binding cassette domain-containing protein [Phycisphaerales bacterium]